MSGSDNSTACSPQRELLFKRQPETSEIAQDTARKKPESDAGGPRANPRCVAASGATSRLADSSASAK